MDFVFKQFPDGFTNNLFLLDTIFDNLTSMNFSRICVEISISFLFSFLSLFIYSFVRSFIIYFFCFEFYGAVM